MGIDQSKACSFENGFNCMAGGRKKRKKKDKRLGPFTVEEKLALTLDLNNDHYLDEEELKKLFFKLKDLKCRWSTKKFSITTYPGFEAKAMIKRLGSNGEVAVDDFVEDFHDIAEENPEGMQKLLDTLWDDYVAQLTDEDKLMVCLDRDEDDTIDVEELAVLYNCIYRIHPDFYPEGMDPWAEAEAEIKRNGGSDGMLTKEEFKSMSKVFQRFEERPDIYKEVVEALWEEMTDPRAIEARDIAATMIQGLVRSRTAKKRVQGMREDRAATKVQSGIRGKKARSEVKKKKQNRDEGL